jgi:hypothetical protein
MVGPTASLNALERETYATGKFLPAPISHMLSQQPWYIDKYQHYLLLIVPLLVYFICRYYIITSFTSLHFTFHFLSSCLHVYAEHNFPHQATSLPLICSYAKSLCYLSCYLLFYPTHIILLQLTMKATCS